ncbi:arylsulfatase [Belliella marina]|uniref:Arylsulfatase n=1 Tax=Belliella marina TaxID=1644146 RepID=A0ABW4VND3_9BACT
MLKIKSLLFFMIFFSLSRLCMGQKELPNIIFIMADDLGIGDIEPYGQEIIKTPNLNKLALEGMKFEDFYAGSTVCAPSRASLMTGQHTGNTFVRGNGEYPLLGDVEILPELLKKAGYTNAMYGKWGLGLEGSEGSPEKRGWDIFLGHVHHVSAHFQKPDTLDMVSEGKLSRVSIPKGTYANDLFTEKAISFIEEFRQEPFFVYLSLTIPHAELVVPDRYMEPYLNLEGESIFPSEIDWPEGRHYGPQSKPRAAYAALISSVDDYVGQIMKALDESGKKDNTILIFTSDNGTHIEGGRRIEDVDFFQSSGVHKGVKRDLYSGGIKEPFIIRWPNIVKENSSTLHRAAFWDVYATFSDIIGFQVDKRDGISFLPTLKGISQRKKHDYLYWEFHEFGGKQALLKGDWKVIRLDVGKNPSNQVELYNIKIDPAENHDLAAEYPKKVRRLTRELDSVRTKNNTFNFGKN